MPNDAPIISYEFRFFGGEQNSYFFTTSTRVVYQVKFVPSAYLFVDYVDQPVNAYEMVIAVADSPGGSRIPADPLTEPTIRAIFLDFFRSIEHVIIYICDSSDGREKARFRKFTSWFYRKISIEYAHLFKLDTLLTDDDRVTFLSGILSTKNPYFSQFVELFKHLSEATK